MNISRKLEVVFGLLFGMSLITYSYFVDFPLANRVTENGNVFSGNYWSGFNLLMLVAWTIGVPVGSYFHATRGSRLALGLLFLLGGIYVLLSALVVTLGAFNGQHWSFLAPSVLALAVILFAI